MIGIGRLPANRCGICKGEKTPTTYNSATTGVHMVTVLLCSRCDLAPDPPVSLPTPPTE